MKKSLIFSLAASAILIASATPPLQAQDQTVSGNLTVTGTADLQGNALNIGSWSGTTSEPGMALIYVDGTTAGANFIANRPTAVWQWWSNNGSANVLSMKLDQNNQLILYSGTLAAITLSPSGTSAFTGSIAVSGTDNELPNQILTGSGSVLTQGLGDNRYLSLAAASGYLTLGAGDARYVQSGSSIVIGSGGNVGIGTGITNPVATLTVNGNVSLDSQSITSDGAGNLQATSFSANNFGVANLITGNNGFANEILVDDPESGDGIIRFTVNGPWAGSGGSRFYFYDCADGGTIYIEPSDAGNQHATFMGVTASITYFGSYGDFSGNGADVGFFTRASGDGSPQDERIRIKADTGNVGIDTTTPAYTLDVSGSGRFSGPVYIAPQGDLDMGNFTADPSQSQSQNNNDSMSAGGFRGSAASSVTSGTASSH